MLIYILIKLPQSLALSPLNLIKFNKNEYLFILTFIICLAAILIMGIELYRQKTKKKIQLKKLESEVVRLKVAISERTKNLEIALEKAEESNRLKSLFLANMSHEIRTPLNSILGFSELIIENEIRSDQKVLYAAQILQNGQNLLKLFDQIFHLAIFEAGKVTIRKEEFNLYDMLEKLFKKTKHKINATEKNIHFTFNIENPNFRIRTDLSKLKLILENLLDNAIKFTDKGIIDITCLKLDNHFLFQITDSGCGIDEIDIDIIFDPFTQGSETLRKIKGGSGLGLSNVKNYVILLGGKIWCTRNLPTGTIFYFTLPALQNVEEEFSLMKSLSFFKN